MGGGNLFEQVGVRDGQASHLIVRLPGAAIDTVDHRESVILAESVRQRSEPERRHLRERERREFGSLRRCSRRVAKLCDRLLDRSCPIVRQGFPGPTLELVVSLHPSKLSPEGHGFCPLRRLRVLCEFLQRVDCGVCGDFGHQRCHRLA